MLGKDRLGAQGRAVLEAARRDIAAHTRDLATSTLRAIEGEPVAPTPPAAGFETKLLDADAFGKKVTASQVLPFLVDGRVYLGDEDGDVVVMAHGREKKQIAEMNMGSAVYGTVVPANGVLFLNNRSQLFALAVK
jgi:hypothetical protein